MNVFYTYTLRCGFARVFTPQAKKLTLEVYRRRNLNQNLWGVGVC